MKMATTAGATHFAENNKGNRVSFLVLVIKDF
jgi:hypothetical protein